MRHPAGRHHDLLPTRVEEPRHQRVVFNINSKNQLSVRWLRDAYVAPQNFTNLAIYERHIPGTNTAAHWTYIANSSTVNSFQFSFTGNVIKEKVGIRPNPIFVTTFTRAG